MTQTALNATPAAGAVVREQLRTVGGALRTPALVVGAIAAIGTALIVLDVVRRGVVLDFHPEHQVLPSVVGFLFPVAVWMGVRPFGDDLLWTLPVERRGHALARVLAGWTWLMAAVAVFVLWQLALAMLSGGNILGEETVLLVAASELGATQIEPSALRRVSWSAQPAFWLVPFTGATGMYLLASALALGTRRPLWWIVGTPLLMLLLALLNDVTDGAWHYLHPERLIELVVGGPYGMDAFLTARAGLLEIDLTLTTGESVAAWRGVPELGEWTAATLLWLGAGLLLLWAAASRHRERRRT